MSRHRNVRNLTHDDYYDEYDDAYDDYYEEEEEEEDHYYQQQQEERRQRKAADEQRFLHEQATAPSKKAIVSTPSYSEKEKILLDMNFTKEQSRWALAQTNGSVEASVDLLVKRLDSSALEPPAGISKPPPGLTKPSSPLSTTILNTVTFGSKDLVSSAPKEEPKLVSTKEERKATTPPRTRKTDFGPMPKIPQQILESIQKQRSRLAMVVLGHVDAGKSTLMGQLLLQLGHVQKRTVTKYQKQAAELGKGSFALAWVMDEDESERERGVTMEIGTKYASTEKHNIVILDAPGHADFIPAMITGAASADVGLLVVAATPGEFEAGFEVNEGQPGGQTREHVILARGLGVSQLIVAVNKLDASDPPWSQDRFDAIQSRLMPFLQANGFQQKRIRFVPISGLSGVNVKIRESTVDNLRKWYNGPTLIEAIDGFVPSQRNVNKPFRFVVTDAYAEGKGVSVRGRVVQGVVQDGERLVVLPIGDETAVGRIDHGASLEPDSPERHKYAMAGDSVELFLNGIDFVRLSPGCILSHPHSQLRPTVRKKMQAKLLVMEELAVPIIRGATVLLHMHSIDVPAVLSKLIATFKRDGSVKKERPRVLTGGASANVEITLSAKIAMEPYSECRALGRFVLRRGGDTIALGIVEKAIP